MSALPNKECHLIKAGGDSVFANESTTTRGHPPGSLMITVGAWIGFTRIEILILNI